MRSLRFFLLEGLNWGQKVAGSNLLRGGQKLEKMTFFLKNDIFSIKKPRFSNFELTYIDVFFDEESESDVIFDKKLTPKGSKSCFL